MRLSPLLITLSLFFLFFLFPGLTFAYEVPPYGGHKFIWIKNNRAGFTKEQMQVIAKNYDLVVIGNQHARGDKDIEHANVKRLKEINPNVPVFLYFPATIRHQRALYGLNEFQDSWYLKTLTNQYFPGLDSPETLATVDLTNSQYRQWVLKTIKGFLNSAPYDGLAFDNANRLAAVEDGARYTKALNLIGETKLIFWNNGLANLLQNTTSQLNQENKPVIFNGIARYPSRGERSLDYFNITNGALNEKFCTESNPQNRGYLSPEKTLEDINLQLKYGKEKKIVLQRSNDDFKEELTIQQFNALGRYCYGVFLMGHVPGYTFFKHGLAYSLDQEPNEHLINAQEINLPLGVPRGRYTNDDNLLSRRFHNGYVVVNLGSSNRTWTAPEDLEVWNGGVFVRRLAKDKTMTIKSRDAIFLLKPGANTPNSPKPGDLNGDGKVDLFDFNLLVSKFGNPYTIFDFNAIVANYGQ